MLKKDFFLKHMNENSENDLQKKIRQYPPTEDIKSKLKSSIEWNSFKDVVLKDFYKKKK
jgi:hypothetical protein